MRILVIDGNNLAHFLYPNLGPGQKMTSADSLRLISHLNSYARQFGQSIEVELCLDRFPGDPGSLYDSMRVLWAHFPQNGDDLLIDRFWFHHISQHPCLVITNDEDILDEVNQAGGNSLRVFDFVRRPGLNSPVFREPADLPQVSLPTHNQDENLSGVPFSASIYFRLVEDPRLHDNRKSRLLDQDTNQAAAISTPQPSHPDPELDHFPPVFSEPVIEANPSIEFPTNPLSGIRSSKRGTTTNSNPQNQEIHYILDLDQWPMGEGIRFLAQSFCPRHRIEYKDLIDLINPKKAAADDLRALAELLLFACGNEEDFARRGSLMAQVRLALLQARGKPLSIGDLSTITGLKRNGLQGRIKAKAGRWGVLIFP